MIAAVPERGYAKRVNRCTTDSTANKHAAIASRVPENN
jgi:hypothetical protein